jgi:chaperonin GroEL
MSKEVIFNPIPKMLAGLDKAANAVCGTLGPKGRNVLIDDINYPKTINEGGTIAGNIVLEDRVENAGANYIRNTTGQTSDDAGDGRSTTAALVHALAHACVERPENPMEIRESLTIAGNKILKEISKKSIKISKNDIEKVALISSEDKEVAHLISEIINKLGDKAVINVEDSKTFATDYEIVDGFEVALGFMSPAFITDKKTAKAIHQDIRVLCVEKKISNISDISRIFEMFKKENIGSCIIVCDDIDDSILGLLAVNNQAGTFKSVVIRATNMFLEDIAGYVGAKIISNTTGITFQNFEKEYLGYAKKVISDANKTLFIGNGISHKQYVKELDAKAEGEPNMYTQANMKKRVAKLSGGIAVLRIGASTDAEREYKKPKAEDAVKAVKGALEEGVIEGGGMTLWRIAQEMKPKTIGEEILKKALISPLQWILKNAGLDYSEIVMNLPKGMGYNAKTNKYENLLESGIIDPTKVERVALENAISSVGIFITTSAIVTDYIKQDEKRS